MGAGKGWSEEESVAGCTAYIRVSEDSLRGNGKKKDRFQNEVLVEFNKVKAQDGCSFKASERTGEAIIQRFKKARCEFLKIEGIVSSIKSKNPTGSPSDDDIFRAATAVYNGEGTIGNMYSYFNNKSLCIGPLFTFRLCLQYLRTTHTWKLICLSKFKKKNENVAGEGGVVDGSVQEIEGQTMGEGQGNAESETTPAQHALGAPQSANGTQGSTNSDAQVARLQRPPGVKHSQTARELAKRNAAIAQGSEGIHALAEASRKRNKIAEELVKVEKEGTLMKLFSMEGTDPSVRRHFLEIAQAKALAELEKSGAPMSRAQAIPLQQSSAGGSHVSSAVRFLPTSVGVSQERSAEETSFEKDVVGN